MKNVLLLFVFSFTFFSLSVSGQTLSNQEIKSFMEEATKTMDLPFEMPGTGVIMQSITTFGRNIIYTYQVPEDWYLLESAKEELIKTLPEKQKNLYFNEQINLMYNYTRNNSLVDKVYISYDNFGTRIELNQLGEYISYKNHPKAKGVNIKIKDPLAFEKQEGDRPNIVAKFNNKKQNLIYLLQINDLPFFISTSSFEQDLSSSQEVESFAKEYISDLNVSYVSSKLTKVDRYPAIEVVVDQTLTILDNKILVRGVMWILYYEDKLINLFATCPKEDFKKNYFAFLKITNSILFEDQYNSMSNNYVGDYQNFDLYVNQFYKELEASGILKVRPKQINIKLEALDESKKTYHIHGYSTGYNNDDVIDITINKRSWNTFSKAQKYYLIFHELSHDVLNLDDLESNNPNENSIMYPSIGAYKNLTMNDFIDNFNVLLEEYKLNNSNEINNDNSFSYSEDELKLLAEEHLKELKLLTTPNEYAILELGYDLKKYSRCLVEKMIEKFTVSELQNMSSNNLIIFKSLQESCLKTNVK